MTEYKVPKQTKLLLSATKEVPDTAVSAQALAAMYSAGWPDPLPRFIAAAIYMGCSYVMNVGQMAYEAGSLNVEEHSAIQGVSELAMQVWKTLYGKLPEESE
jgi:hypothetical protein